MMTVRHGKWIAGAILLLVVLLVFPNPWRPIQRATSCLSNEKQIMLGMLVYAHDNDDRLPQSDKWQAQVSPEIRNDNVYRCPAAAPNAGPDYAMVAMWSGAATKGINLNQNAVVLYEVAGGQPILRHPWNERDRYDDLYSYLRSIGKPGGMNLGYADGHCKWHSEFPPQVLSEGRYPGALPARPPSAFDSFRWQLRRLFFGRGERA